MSWSTSTNKAISKDGTDGAGTLEIPTPTLGTWAAKEAEEQFSAAVVAAKILAAVVGRGNDKINVTLAGHANPDHAPAEGWSPESITITVSVYR